MTDFKDYTSGETKIRARKVTEDAEDILTVGNTTVRANKGDYVVERPDSPRGIYDVIPGDKWKDVTSKDTARSSRTRNAASAPTNADGSDASGAPAGA